MPIQALTALKTASPRGLGEWQQAQLSEALFEIRNENDNKESIGCVQLTRTSSSEFQLMHLQSTKPRDFCVRV